MLREKKILINYILYFLVGLFIFLFGMFYGTNTTHALTNKNTIQFYDNNGNSASWVTTNYISQIQRSEATFTTQANSFGGLVLAMLPTPVVNNHTYSIFLSVGAESNGGFTELSSKNCIGLGNDYQSAINSYINCSYTPVYSRGSGNTGDYTRGLFWIFNSRQNASYIALPYTTQYTCSGCLQYSYGIEIEDNGDYTNLSESELNSAISSQTNSIDTTIANMQSSIANSITQGNNSILQNNNTNRQAIIDNNNTNRQAIIDNQNQNTQDITNNQNNIYLNKCHNLFNENNAKTVSNYTVDLGSSNYGMLITLEPNTQYTISRFLDNSITSDTSYNLRVSLYETPTNYIFYLNNPTYLPTITSGYYTFTTGSSGKVYIVERYATDTKLNTYFNDVKVQIEKGSTSSSYCEFGSHTTNKLDEAETTRKGILGKLSDFFNTMFSNENADVSGLNNMVGWLPPGPVDSIINLPLSLFNSLLNTITGTCSAVTLTLPFVNKSLTLPCFNTFMTQYLTGFSTLWTLIGTIISVFILYRYLLSLYKWIDDTLTLRENNLPGYYDDNWGGGA